MQPFWDPIILLSFDVEPTPLQVCMCDSSNCYLLLLGVTNLHPSQVVVRIRQGNGWVGLVIEPHRSREASNVQNRVMHESLRTSGHLLISKKNETSWHLKDSERFPIKPEHLRTLFFLAL